MRGIRLRLFLPALAAICGSTASVADEYAYEYSRLGIGNVSIFAGGKFLNEYDWSPAAEQSEMGIQATWTPKYWPVGFALAYFTSYGEGPDQENGESTRFKAYTHEVQVGAEKIWLIESSWRPYVGGGLVYGKGEASIGSDSASNNAIGGWVGAGFTYIFAQHFSLGVDNRFSYIPLHLEGQRYQAGGVHLGATIGYAW